jgi:hypothetical protein
MITLRFIVAVFFTSLGSLAIAQLPATDLYAVSYSLNGDRGTVRSVSYLSAFNPDGYNNQPYYDGSRYLYFTTDYYDEATEVARLDLDEQILERLTQSPESEYSPQSHPGGRSYTTVRVEEDSSQTLTAYSLKSGRHKNFAPSLDNVAYYRWLDDQHAVVTTLPVPMTLSVYQREQDSLAIVDQAVGRCLQVVNDDLVYYMTLDDRTSSVATYNTMTGDIVCICPALEGAQDFLVLPGGRVLMARGAEVYLYIRDSWKSILDLSAYGITDISRLAARRGQLFVVNKTK